MPNTITMREIVLFLAMASAGCSSSSHAIDMTPDGGGGGDDGGSTTGGTPATFNVFDQIPQFGIYSDTDPDYTPPPGVLMWSHGTVFVTKLDETQKAGIGADLAARITYIAQCDNYDRLGGLFFIVEPKGQAPQPTDPRTEIVRFITPFSDFSQGALATHVYPDADISVYANTLADTSHDVWIGIAGGSNPYGGDPCDAAGKPADYKAVGFKYSVDFVSTQPLTSGSTVALTAISNVQETSVPISGTFTNPGGEVTGHVTVIVSGHGSDANGDEYEYTQDTVTVNGQQVGSFSTQIDCAPYAKFSPDGNPGIFKGNNSYNPRNWCPGALVPSHSFPVTLAAGENSVSLGVSPSKVPSGSYYATTINFSSP